jgi:hypothetical protein
MKGLMLAEEQVRYVIGIIIAIVIVFCLWWFLFHREPDQEAERSAAEFVRAVETCCENGVARAKIQLPQKYQPADIWNQYAPFNLKTSGGLGREPYFLMYWEKFPPDSPYGSDILGIGGSLIAPWSEDLPWNSNMMTTLAFDFLAIGMDATGIKSGANEAFSEALEGAKAEALKDAIEGVEEAASFSDKAKDIVVTAAEKGKFAVKWAGREAIILGTESMVYEIACMYIFDKTVGDCLPIAIGSAVGTEILRKVALPKIGEKLNEKITEIIGKGKIKADFKDVMKAGEEVADEMTEEAENVLEESVKFKIDMATKVAYLEEGNPMFESIRQNGEEIFEKTGSWPKELPGDSKFKFVTEIENGQEVLKDITYDIGSWKDGIKEKLVGPLNWLAENVYGPKGIMGDTLGTPETINQISQAGKQLIKEYSDEGIEESGKIIYDAMKNAGKNPKNVDDAANIFRGLIYNFEKEGERGSLLVFEKGLPLGELVKECEGDCWKSLYYGYIEYASKNKDESKLFVRLLETTRMKTKMGVKGVLEMYSQGTLGYMVLRYQDLYTPLGATYWDKQMSYSMSSYAGEICDDNEICLQMGFFVRRYPLPDSCSEERGVGIKNIVLSRVSAVAGNPSFYLVSPCYAEVELTRSGDTIYVKPLMCPDKKDALGSSVNNYCYATGNMVNGYVGAEVGAAAGNCLVAALCAVATEGIGLPDAILACIGIKYPGICQTAGSITRTLIDYAREAYLKYPDVYNNLGGLRDFTCNEQDPSCEFCYK